MNGEQQALARRFLACRDWCWKPGMKVDFGTANGFVVHVFSETWDEKSRSIKPFDEIAVSFDVEYPPAPINEPELSVHLLPDITDAGTLAHIAETVQAVGEIPGAHAHSPGQWGWGWQVYIPGRGWIARAAPTQAEAWLLAWEGLSAEPTGRFDPQQSSPR